MTDENLTPGGRPIYDADFDPLASGAQPGSSLMAAVSPIARWALKATAFADAWHAKFKVTPGICLIADALSVAQHETLCGDAWPGEYNWGALQLRATLTDLERGVLQGLAPNPQNVKLARGMLAAAVVAGTVPDEPNGALHVDSSPGRGWYWVFFRKFPNDTAGAAFFIHVLCENRPGCMSILKSATQNWSTDLLDLASAMYATHYYEGFRIPTQMYTKPDGTKVTGVVMNELDYASSLEKIAPTIFDALQGWEHPPLPVQYDLSSVQGTQSALTYLAGKYGGRWQKMDPQG